MTVCGFCQAVSRGSLTVCGSCQGVSRGLLGFPRLSLHSLDKFTGTECLLGGPEVRVRCGLGAALGVCHLRVLSFSLSTGLTVAAPLKPALLNVGLRVLPTKRKAALPAATLPICPGEACQPLTADVPAVRRTRATDESGARDELANRCQSGLCPARCAQRRALSARSASARLQCAPDSSMSVCDRASIS